MCVCLPYNLRNWVVCSKPRCKPLLPIHITKCNKGNKNHQAKEWSTKRTEIWRYLNRSSHVLSVFIDCEERKTRRKEGRNSDTLWERERLFFDSESLRLLWGVVLLLPAELWWLWMKRERRRGTGERGSEEGDLC